MIRLTDAITLVQRKKELRSILLDTGKTVEVIIGNRKMKGVISTLDCTIKQTNMFDSSFSFLDINLTVNNVIISNEDNYI